MPVVVKSIAGKYKFIKCYVEQEGELENLVSYLDGMNLEIVSWDFGYGLFIVKEKATLG
jgi:hypothetical protein